MVCWLRPRVWIPRCAVEAVCGGVEESEAERMLMSCMLWSFMFSRKSGQ